MLAARKVFVTKGFESTKMRDVAEYAGINKGLIEYYYRTKQCLFDSVFEQAFLTYMPTVLDIFISDDTFENKIDTIVDGYFKLINENPYVVEFFLAEIKRNPGRLSDNLYLKGFQLNRLQNYLDQEAEKGNMKKIKAEHFMCNLLGLVLLPFCTEPLLCKMLNVDEQTLQQTFLQERKMYVKDMLIHSISAKY